MAPHYKFESDINIVDLMKEELPNEFLTHQEEQIPQEGIYGEEVLSQQMVFLKYKLQQLQHQLQQFELEKQQQTQEIIEQQIPQQLQQLQLQLKELQLQMPRELFIFVMHVPQQQQIDIYVEQQVLEQLQFQLKELQKQMQYRIIIAHIEAPHTGKYVAIQMYRIYEVIKLVEHKLKILQLQQQLEKVEQQQQTSHPQLLEEIIQQKQLKGLRLVLEKLQLYLQCMLFQCQIIEPFEYQVVPEPQYQQMVEELQETRHQLQNHLHHLQQLQVKQLLEQVQKKFNKQSRLAQNKLEFFQQLKQYINQKEQHEMQLPPENYQFVVFKEYLRQLLLQQELERLHFLLEQFEFEEQLMHIEAQMDYSIEQLLQRQEPEQQSLEQLQSVKLHLKYIQHKLQKGIIGADHIHQIYSGDLEKSTTTNEFLEGLVTEVAEKVDDIFYQIIIQTTEAEFQQELIVELENMKDELYKQQIEH